MSARIYIFFICVTVFGSGGDGFGFFWEILFLGEKTANRVFLGVLSKQKWTDYKKAPSF
jgi:hypothetical protein